MIKTKAIWLGIAIWIIITVVFSKFDAPADGFSSIGFPLHFYTYFEGKSASGSSIDHGIILTYLLVDFIALIVFIVLLHVILSGRRKPIKIHL
ncbi:hypothetical protein [Mucilaginibacter lappiensis]|uniref:Membrane protein n=1 Tax=Mucilaginibacter lappiensis TaxID=354630 RepID=A0A1N7FQ70_9SPHI|nr:hypothetical protein [Mucilaginibacter lappiensis]MBB6112496.1 putative membrane protein [Mucilaginibacter lappiensis]MBB6129252.1 putative membrane protein [Mucilaginibacter lappiensis]SIS02386.1 putative solute:sodium symporter small subunit [Mucilaginibacter lappiensis]